jgi:hypothetical protein
MGSEEAPSNYSSTSVSEFKTVVLSYALTYLQMNLSVIPLVYGDKKPAIEWKEYQDRRATEEEVRKWFSKLHNVGIVCGRVSDNLVVLDIESEELFQKFYEKLDKEYPDLRDIVLGTWIVKTGKGRHVYLRVKASDDEFENRVVNDKHENFFEVRAKNEYVVAPPSLHPSGKRYEFLNAGGTKDHIAEVDIQSLGKIVVVLHEVTGFTKCRNLAIMLGIEEKEEVVKGEIRKKPKLGRLNNKEIEEIIKVLKLYYVSGHRQNLCLHLSGCLARLGVHPESVARIIYQLQKDALERGESKDSIEQRLSTISYTYQKLNIWNDSIRNELEQLYQQLGVDARKTYTWRDIGEREFITGCQKLQEEFQSVLIEKGLSGEEALAQASKDVNVIKLAVRGGGWESVAWLECKNNVPTKWVTVGKYGIYLVKVKHTSSNIERTVQRISSAVITNVRRVQFYMLGNEEQFYRICFNIEDVAERCHTVAFSEIPYQIYRVGGLQKGFEYPVQELVRWLEEGEPIRAYYAPGAWVNDEHLVIVNESGYNPEWKRTVRLNVAQSIDREYVKQALQCIKKLVESYRNPNKASLVLSFAVVAPLHLWFKQLFGIGFHMMIRGERMTGKTLLIDLLKLLYMLPDHDEDPRTDYQMRVLLAKTTMPALIPECVRACTDDKLLSLWKESATMINLVFAGGPYKGFYYALRSIIAATNERIDIPTDLVDKVLVVDIDVEDGIELGRCKGCTPLTMSSSAREGVKMLGYYILQKLGDKLEEFKKLAGLDRREIMRGLVKIGYEVWCEVLREYGLEPFPSPFTDDGLLVTEEEQFAEEERARFSEIVEEFIKDVVKEKEDECSSYTHTMENPACYEVKILVNAFKGGRATEVTCNVEKNSKVCDEQSLKMLDLLGFVRIVDVDRAREYIAMNRSLFNRFIKFLKMEYRMGEREVERLRSALAVKLTTVLFRYGGGNDVDKKTVYKLSLV